MSSKLEINLPQSLLKLLVEGYIELTMSIFLGLYEIFVVVMTFDWDRILKFGPGDILSMTLTLIILVFVVLAPAYSIVFILNQKKVKPP